MPQDPQQLQHAAATESSARQGERRRGSPLASGAAPVSASGRGLVSEGASADPRPRQSRAGPGLGVGGGKGRVVGAPVQPPAFLRPSKLRRLPRVPAAPLGNLVLHEPRKLASTTLLALRSGLQCPCAASPETQKPAKDTGLIKRHCLPSALVSNQFPLLLRAS